MNNDIAVYNRDGDRTESLTVPESHLEREKGYQAVFETVQAVLANQRRGTASSKTRSEVRGGGAKPYRQKGTGRARAGSIRSPLWVGGGVTFGPKPRSYRKRVNKKVKRLALRRAFTERLDEGAVQAIEEFSFSVPSTKAAAGILKAIGAEKETAMVVLGQADATAKKSASNLGNVFITEGNKVNAYLLLKYDKVIFTKGGWENFSKRLEGSTANERSL